MRYLLLVLSIICFSCGNDTKQATVSEETTTTTYYLIRHAEKDRNTTDNPELTEEGKKRAAHWADHFKNIDLDAVYSTNYKRTLATAAPTAQKKGLTVQQYDPTKLYDENFQKATFGKNVLIVGHSNTTPAFVNTILGDHRYGDIPDTENGMLYTVWVHDNGTKAVREEKIPVN
tara:strand:+ start:157835 stop:158356 length:522 start_codon:yes stop_codon:yes gene_type:complete